MTNNHRAEAERLLADAREWGQETELGELTCLAYSAVHALFAIHDTLTAPDRYAANEAKQREETTQEAAGDDLTASGDEGGPVEGGEADNTEEPLLCPKCGPAGDTIDEHNARGCRYVMCDCKLSPSDIARALIERATRRGDRHG